MNWFYFPLQLLQSQISLFALFFVLSFFFRPVTKLRYELSFFFQNLFLPFVLEIQNIYQNILYNYDTKIQKNSKSQWYEDKRLRNETLKDQQMSDPYTQRENLEKEIQKLEKDMDYSSNKSQKLEHYWEELTNTYYSSNSEQNDVNSVSQSIPEREREREREKEKKESPRNESLPKFMNLDQKAIQVITDTKVRFADIAGNEEAKKELQEVVQFLKNPERFSKLGATVPKGVLLGGPPGTGKTLLAKAVAGEAQIPFLKVAGSQFVELLVGVGAARVRELFEKAVSLRPSIIFIDEIDSIARTRAGSTSMGGANDEREQTLNQLLTEMDGFKTKTGVLVIAATNRIDILDPAIKRPGRFDRQIMLTNPNVIEREAILRVHAAGKVLDESVTLTQIAQRTLGFSGADLANLLNEAAILAARLKKETISMQEVNMSIDRILLGLERKKISRIKSRQLTAFYEMGNAYISTLVNSTHSIEKITLTPRGNKKGTTLSAPPLSQYNSREMFLHEVFIGIAGRAAEETLLGRGECTTTSQQDLYKITRILRTMILRYAMARLQEFKQQAQKRNLSLLGSDVKLEITNVIDNYMTNLMDMTYHEMMTFIQTIRPNGERLVDELLLSEELTGMEVRTIMSEFIDESAIPYYDSLYATREALIYEMLMIRFAKSRVSLYDEIDVLLEKVKM